MSTRLIIGVDEVGYGAIAGPLVVAAVAFWSNTRKPVLKRFSFERGGDVPVQDSKKLNHKLLPRFEELIWERCVDHEVLLKPPAEIDRVGVNAVRNNAMCAVVQRLLERIAFSHPGEVESYLVIVDGDIDLGECHFKYKAQPRADQDVWQVGAASILAKHRQITEMHLLHARDKRYAWDKNKGYPTAAHVEALREYGVSRYHRRSYKTVKELLDG